MELKLDKREILSIIFKYIPKDNCAVFLFGSFAKNKVYPSSDIDVGVICGSPLNNLALARIREALEKVRTLRDIDVVDFSSVNDKKFLKVALREARIWHQTKKSKVFLDSLRMRIKD